MKLTNEQDAIKQAIEAGYELPWTTRKHLASMRHRDNKAVVLQDLAFWQALGKARRWEERYFKCGAECKNEILGGGWKYEALRYFETRLSNGDMKAYWKSLP